MQELKRRYYVSIEEINRIFKGKKILEVIDLEVDSEEIRFEFENEESIEMYHSQDCCESVYVEDISGDRDLSGAIFYEIIEKECNKEALMDWEDSFTWTFYTIRTSKGYLDIRWYGSSNGYYSESVDFGISYLEEN